MNAADIPGVYSQGQKLFTINLPSCKGQRVYGEQIRMIKGMEYRSWNPFRSKLAAAILKNAPAINISSSSQILYLGAATGTTVSHLSDICFDGVIYAVESSSVAGKTLLKSIKKRENVIPIIENANHPDRYDHLVPQVDFIYQDISQRNQAQIFIINAKRYLKEKGSGVLMVKARSVDVALKPKKVYEIVEKRLNESSFKVTETIDLSPYEKDHAALFVKSML